MDLHNFRKWLRLCKPSGSKGKVQNRYQSASSCHHIQSVLLLLGHIDGWTYSHSAIGVPTLPEYRSDIAEALLRYITGFPLLQTALLQWKAMLQSRIRTMLHTDVRSNVQTSSDQRSRYNRLAVLSF